MQVGPYKLSFSKLQSQALVRAGQTPLGTCSYLQQNIFNQQRAGADGTLIPNKHKALPERH
jgi:hypothetical protein